MGSADKVYNKWKVEESEYNGKGQDEFIGELRAVLMVVHDVGWEDDCEHSESQMEMTQKVVIATSFGFVDIDFHEALSLWRRGLIGTSGCKRLILLKDGTGRCSDRFINSDSFYL